MKGEYMGIYEKQVPDVVIKRLPRYYRYLSELLKMDIKRISSGALSQKMNVTASQIRQDFNFFGGFGQQGYGYNVEYLHSTIGDILGVKNGNTAIIIGAGNLGKALANHDSIQRRGFDILGMFDNNPSVIGEEVNGNTVYDIKDLENFILENRVDVAIIAIPKDHVQEIATRVINAGVRGILNFAYTEIKTDKKVAIENVHITDSLMTLSYKLNLERTEY